MQVASMPLVFVATQALLIVCGAHSAVFFQKAAAVVVIVNHVHIQDCEKRSKGCMHEMN